MKPLIFFGIIAIGILISLFTLSKCDRGEKSQTAVPEIENIKVDPKAEAPGAENTLSKTEVTPAATENPEKVAVANVPVTPAPASTDAPEPPTAAPPSAPPIAMKPGQIPLFETNKETPSGVVGEIANSIMNKDFKTFLELAGDSIPPEVREKLKALIEDPNLKIDPDRPFWEVAKSSRDSVRWMLNFVPDKAGDATAAKALVLDLQKSADGEFKVVSVGLPPTVKEVVALVQNSDPEQLDSLTIAQAFSQAVLSEDFISARKLCGPKVSDERIAGLMIALEEGGFELREDRPLIVTLSRDTVSWVLSRVQSPSQASEFALELEKEKSWIINGLTFGKVIAALAKEVDGPYSPLVEDPAGGESLVVYFEFDEAGLSSRADTQLKIIAEILNKDPSRQIRITGHADALGTDDYNRGLSQRRADSIRTAIISRGANPNQVITEGYGATKPRKPNFNSDGTDNPLGRSENRRAEVYLDF